MSQPPSVCLLDAPQMTTALARMADEIAQAVTSEASLVLVGIRSRGLPLAERLSVLLEQRTGKPVPVGSLDITLYRDDLEVAGAPIVRPTEIPFSLKGKVVALIDDVAFTGRTVRAALDALQDHGRPNRVWYGVLVDRGGRELPIQPDFVGVKAEVGPQQRISVRVQELDQTDGVFLESKA